MKNRKKQFGAISLLVVLGVMVVALSGFQDGNSPPARKADLQFDQYAPEQPIAYSHKLHAGDLEIPCEFCHTYARRSRTAGIPAMEQCMSCHKIMATDRPAIQQIAAMYEKNQAIEWVKVHDLPDYVYFSHKRHVSAGFECQTCHGPVETMDVVAREAPLTMGWCVNCHREHREQGAALDCLVCHK